MRAVEPIPRLRTAGVIAQELGEPLHRVVYVLRTRPSIAPVARAGRLRLFDLAAVAMIRCALDAIAERKGAANV